MANTGMTCDPKVGTEREFKAIYNAEASTALTHGMVVVFGIAAAEIAYAAEVAAGTPYAGCTPVVLTTTASDPLVFGVVWDPSGQTVKAGERGTVMTKGFHPAVKTTSTVTAATHHLECDAAAGTAKGVAFGSVAANACIGYPLEDGSASPDTCAAYLCINK